VGGGTEFGGAEDDEGCDDKAETKLDQFWQFSDIEVRALVARGMVAWLRPVVCVSVCL
jgi:hypothetical protein